MLPALSALSCHMVSFSFFLIRFPFLIPACVPSDVKGTLRKIRVQCRVWETSGVCRFQLILLWEVRWDGEHAHSTESPQMLFCRKFALAHGHSQYLNNSNSASLWLELLVNVLNSVSLEVQSHSQTFAQFILLY